MRNRPISVPRPLVRTNQWFIVIFVVLTWVTHQSWLLLVPLAAGLLGLFFGFNPIMRVAKLFLRNDPSSYVPEEWDQQQFNQWIAVICLAVAYGAYALNYMMLGHIFTIMVAVAAFVAILGFCIGCYIRYHWKMYKHQRDRSRR